MLRQLIQKLPGGLLIVTYPVLIYLLLSYQIAWLGTVIVCGVLVWKLRHRENWLWLTIALLTGVLIAARLFSIDAILKLSPLLIHSSLLIIFIQSLNTTPLIERFARLDFGDPLPPGIADYCRNVTLIWVLFFAANIIGGIWLAVWGSDAAWVVYNGMIVYLLITALLLGEYLWRRIAFRHLKISSLTETIRCIADNGHNIWGQGKRDDI